MIGFDIGCHEAI